MRKQFVVLNEDNVLLKFKEDFVSPVKLSNGQFMLKVTECNETYLVRYKKYYRKDILAAVDAGQILQDVVKYTTISDNSPFALKHDELGNKYFKRLHSGDDSEVNPFQTIPPGESRTIDIEIDYPHAKIEAMEVIGAGAGHSCDLFILDSGVGSYSGVPFLTLNQFSFNACIAKDYHRFASRYDADLFLGMVVRIEIFNWSQEESIVGLNIELNEVRKP